MKKQTTSQRETPSVLHLESLQASAVLVGYTKTEPGVKKVEKFPFYSSLTWKYFIHFCCRSNCSVFMQCVHAVFSCSVLLLKDVMSCKLNYLL